MRFPVRFSRFLGAGTDPARQLGQATDQNPNTAGSGAVPILPNDASDNVLITKFANASSWPFQRIVLGYRYKGAGAAPAIPGVGLWLYDFKTEQWYRLPTLVTVNPNQMTMADSVVLMEGTPRSQQTVLEPTAGSFECWVAVPTVGGAPDGEYTFIVGPDLSTSP